MLNMGSLVCGGQLKHAICNFLLQSALSIDENRNIKYGAESMYSPFCRQSVDTDWQSHCYRILLSAVVVKAKIQWQQGQFIYVLGSEINGKDGTGIPHCPKNGVWSS